MFRLIHWIGAIGNEFYQVANELASLLDVVQVERRARRKQLVITLTLPHLARTFTFALLVASISGILYTLGPVIAPIPLTVVATTIQPANTGVDVAKKPSSGLARSVPVTLRAPSIGLDTSLIKLGKNPDGTLATPDRYDVAGWYEFAPTPGEIGPAIIVGHVDNYLGAAVFFYLKDLQPGQSIFVTRSDNKIVEFKVDSVELFDQQNFPTNAVYGNIDYAGLRLITCGGTFNPLTGHYSHNTVVYARAVLI